MSWLLLDAGNTALKWLLVPAAQPRWPELPAADAPEAAPVRRGGTIAIDAPDLDTALAGACAQASALGGGTAPGAVFGCAVTSAERIAAIEAALQRCGAGPVQWHGAAERFEHDGIVLRNGYRQPAQLGADRWHAMIGARARFPQTALVLVTAGTASTIDGVGADGMFCGGVIAPGLALMRASLAQGTARLPLAEGRYLAHPDNTADAIWTGILDAQLGLIERRVRRMREIAGARPTIVVAGGHGAALAALLQEHGNLGPVVRAPDLVLRGLWHQARAGCARALGATP